MADSNPAPNNVEVLSQTQVPTASIASSPSVQKPKAATTSRPRTELPAEPFNPYQPFSREVEAPIGNPKAQLSLRLEGQVGLFYNRDDTTRVPTLVELNMTNYRAAAYRVLISVIGQEMLKHKPLDITSMQNVINNLADTLADGITVMTYCKLRNVNYMDDRVAARFRRTPKVPSPFEVPLPFAYAISQLGHIKISGLPRELFYAPTTPAGADENFCLPQGHIWIPSRYAQQVDYAKTLGLKFAPVDLTVKMGSSWWLYRPTTVGTIEQLQCPFPEENFTESTAMLAMLFCIAPDAGLHNPIVAPDAFGNDNFGSMARLDTPQIAVNFYYAVIDSTSVDYKVDN